MNNYRVLIVIILGLVLTGAALAGVEEDQAEFSAALAKYFGVSSEEVAKIWEAGVSGDEVAVVLRVAQLSNTSSQNIGKMCARGDSWKEIMGIRNLGCDSFYMMIAAKIESGTYAPLFAKYAAVPQTEWKSIPLTDDDIANLVNLKFLSSHYDYSVFKIMDMRDAGKSFLEIGAGTNAIKMAMAAEEKIREKEKARKSSN